MCFFPAILGGLQLRGYIVYPTNVRMPCLLKFLPDLNASVAAGSSSCLASTFYLVFLFLASPLATQFNILFRMILSCILGICLIFGEMIPLGCVYPSKAFAAACWLCRRPRDEGRERPEKNC